MIVRAHLRLAAKIPALVVGPLFVFGPVALGVFMFLSLPNPLARAASIVGGLAVGGFLAYHMIHTFSWAEFDGRRIRARHLYTRRLWDHPLSDVTAVRPMVAMARGHPVNGVIDRVLGPVRGYEIQLVGRRRGIFMAVGDTAGARELAEAVSAAAGKPIDLRNV